ncbi:MAG: hypothetical protein ABW352_15330 [Polyangiales bacterium]
MSYAARSDPERGIATWCWLGPTVTAAEWDRHVADVLAVRTWPHPERRPAVLIHLIDSRFVPNARQRTQLATITDHPMYRANVAVVTRNPVIRGVMQAMAWLRPGNNYQLRAFKGLTHAVAWLETERGKPLELVELLREAHRELGVENRHFDLDRPSTVEL